MDKFDELFQPAEPLLEEYSRKRKQQNASAGVKKIAAFYGVLAKSQDKPDQRPVEVGGYRDETAGEVALLMGDARVVMRAPIDMVTENNTLHTFSIYGSGRQNPYKTPYSHRHTWAAIVWDGPHNIYDLGHALRIYNRNVKRSDLFKSELYSLLLGIASTLDQDIIIGRSTTSCAKCPHCEHRYFIRSQEVRQCEINAMVTEDAETTLPSSVPMDSPYSVSGLTAALKRAQD